MDGETQSTAFAGPRDRGNFRTMIIVSVAAHVVAFAAVVLGSFSQPHRINENKAIQTKLVKLGQDKKDLLPRMPTPPAPPPPAVVTPTVAPAVVKPPEKTSNEKKPSFEDSLKRIEDMERKADDHKGKGDPKGSKSGTVSDFTKQMIGLQWVADVEARIRPNLNIPSVIPDAERGALKVTVTLHVANNGKVLSKSVGQTSGNDLFDKAVLRAIELSSPLPVPPVELREQVQSDGVDIEILGRRQ